MSFFRKVQMCYFSFDDWRWARTFAWGWAEEYVFLCGDLMGWGWDWPYLGVHWVIGKRWLMVTIVHRYIPKLSAGMRRWMINRWILGLAMRTISEHPGVMRLRQAWGFHVELQHHHLQCPFMVRHVFFENYTFQRSLPMSSSVLDSLRIPAQRVIICYSLLVPAQANIETRTFSNLISFQPTKQQKSYGTQTAQFQVVINQRLDDKLNPVGGPSRELWPSWLCHALSEYM